MSHHTVEGERCQWWWDESDISTGAGYTLNNPCSSPAGTTSFNFTLTIAATTATAGRYAAPLTNPAGAANVPEVFVRDPTRYDTHGKLQLAILIELMFLVLCSSSGHY